MRLLSESDSLEKNNLTHSFMQHTRVLGCSQFTRCIPLSKSKATIIKKSGRSFCVSKKVCVLQVYFTSKSWRQILWCVNQSVKYTFYQCFYTYGLRKTVLCLCACFLIIQTSNRICFPLPYLNL